MTLAGIITMVLSIGFVWTLFIVCCRKLIKNRNESRDTNES